MAPTEKAAAAAVTPDPEHLLKLVSTPECLLENMPAAAWWICPNPTWSGWPREAFRRASWGTCSVRFMRSS